VLGGLTVHYPVTNYVPGKCGLPRAVAPLILVLHIVLFYANVT